VEAAIQALGSLRSPSERKSVPLFTALSTTPLALPTIQSLDQTFHQMYFIIHNPKVQTQIDNYDIDRNDANIDTTLFKSLLVDGLSILKKPIEHYLAVSVNIDLSFRQRVACLQAP
jgi:hypothetical protein